MKLKEQKITRLLATLLVVATLIMSFVGAPNKKVEINGKVYIEYDTTLIYPDRHEIIFLTKDVDILSSTIYTLKYGSPVMLNRNVWDKCVWEIDGKREYYKLTITIYEESSDAYLNVKFADSTSIDIALILE